MLTVNLFDELFRHTDCSVAFQKPQHINYVRDQMDWDGITIFTDHYIGDQNKLNVRSGHKIGWLREPQCLHPETYRKAIWDMMENRLDFCLTYWQPLLDYNDFFRFVPYGGVWINRQNCGAKPQQHMVSMLFGDKHACEGHLLRWRIFNEAGHWYPIDFYGARGTPTDYSEATKRLVHEDYCFSIVIETCRQDNEFTEILLDCFAVGTIPIFWGCPNVDKFFNAEGILSFNTIDELRQILRNLSRDEYECRLPAIEDNLHRVAEYAVTEDWIYDHYLKEIA
jgi:hypothetical protein